MNVPFVEIHSAVMPVMEREIANLAVVLDGFDSTRVIRHL